jgi:hypothetical protein
MAICVVAPKTSQTQRSSAIKALLRPEIDPPPRPQLAAPLGVLRGELEAKSRPRRAASLARTAGGVALRRCSRPSAATELTSIRKPR